MGKRTRYETYHGPFEVYLWGDYLLQWRGGPWQPWLVEDYFDAWALAYTYHEGALARTVLVLHAERGELEVREVDVPAWLDAAERAQHILHERALEPPGRLLKMTERALTTCRFCPVKQACDAHDRLHHQTADWHPDYPLP